MSKKGDRDFVLGEVVSLLAPLAEKFYMLGIQLKIDTSKLKTIEKEHSKDINRCLAETIDLWLHDAQTPCTWAKLAEAVKHVGGFGQLVEKILSRAPPNGSNTDLKMQSNDAQEMKDSTSESGYGSESHSQCNESDNDSSLSATTGNTNDCNAATDISLCFEPLPGCGCANNCSLYTLCTEGCPKSHCVKKAQILSRSQPIKSPIIGLGLVDQNDEEADEFEENTERINEKFGDLVYDTCKSLEQQNVKKEDVVLYLVGRFPIMRNALQSAKCLQEVFTVVVTQGCSWFDYKMINDIIKKFGNKKDEERLLEYEEHFRTFAEQRLPKGVNHIEIGGSQALRQGRQKVVIKVDKEWDSIRFSDLDRLLKNFASVFKINRRDLYLADVRKGCIMLTVFIQNSITEEAFPLGMTVSSNQTKLLKDEDIVWITCKQQRFKWRSRPDKKEKQYHANPRSFLNAILVMFILVSISLYATTIQLRASASCRYIMTRSKKASWLIVSNKSDVVTLQCRLNATGQPALDVSYFLNGSHFTEVQPGHNNEVIFQIDRDTEGNCSCGNNIMSNPITLIGSKTPKPCMQHHHQNLPYSNFAKYSKHSDFYSKTCNVHPTNQSRLTPGVVLCGIIIDTLDRHTYQLRSFIEIECYVGLQVCETYNDTSLQLPEYPWYLNHELSSHVCSCGIFISPNNIKFAVLPFTKSCESLMIFHGHLMLTPTRHLIRPKIESHKYLSLYFEEFRIVSESHYLFITTRMSKHLCDRTSIDSFLDLSTCKNLLDYDLRVWTFTNVQCQRFLIQKFINSSSLNNTYLNEPTDHVSYILLFTSRLCGKVFISLHKLILYFYSSSLKNTYLNELTGNVTHTLLFVVRLCEKVFISLECLMSASTGKLSMSDSERCKSQSCYILEVIKIPSERPHLFDEMVFISIESLMDEKCRGKLKLPEHKPQSHFKFEILPEPPRWSAFISLEHLVSTPRGKLKFPDHEPQLHFMLKDSKMLRTGYVQTTIHIIHYTNNEGDVTTSTLILINIRINLWYSKYTAEICHEANSKRTAYLPHPRLKKIACYNVCHSFLKLCLPRFDHRSSQGGWRWYKRTCTLLDVICLSKKETFPLLRYPFPIRASSVNKCYFCHNPPHTLNCHIQFNPIPCYTELVCRCNLKV